MPLSPGQTPITAYFHTENSSSRSQTKKRRITSVETLVNEPPTKKGKLKENDAPGSRATRTKAVAKRQNTPIRNSHPKNVLTPTRAHRGNGSFSSVRDSSPVRPFNFDVPVSQELVAGAELSELTDLSDLEAETVSRTKAMHDPRSSRPIAPTPMRRTRHEPSSKHAAALLTPPPTGSKQVSRTNVRTDPAALSIPNHSELYETPAASSKSVDPGLPTPAMSISRTKRSILHENESVLSSATRRGNAIFTDSLLRGSAEHHRNVNIDDDVFAIPSVSVSQTVVPSSQTQPLELPSPVRSSPMISPTESTNIASRSKPNILIFNTVRLPSSKHSASDSAFFVPSSQTQELTIPSSPSTDLVSHGDDIVDTSQSQEKELIIPSRRILSSPATCPVSHSDDIVETSQSQEKEMTISSWRIPSSLSTRLVSHSDDIMDTNLSQEKAMTLSRQRLVVEPSKSDSVHTCIVPTSQAYEETLSQNIIGGFSVSNNKATRVLPDGKEISEGPGLVETSQKLTEKELGMDTKLDIQPQLAKRIRPNSLGKIDLMNSNTLDSRVEIVRNDFAAPTVPPTGITPVRKCGDTPKTSEPTQEGSQEQIRDTREDKQDDLPTTHSHGIAKVVATPKSPQTRSVEGLSDNNEGDDAENSPHRFPSTAVAAEQDEGSVTEPESDDPDFVTRISIPDRQENQESNRSARSYKRVSSYRDRLPPRSISPTSDMPLERSAQPVARTYSLEDWVRDPDVAPPRISDDDSEIDDETQSSLNTQERNFCAMFTQDSSESTQDFL